MVDYVGRTGTLHLFSQGTEGVIVDSEVNLVTETGHIDVLSLSRNWKRTRSTPPATTRELAHGALASLKIAVTATAGRLYTVPKGVQAEARKALEWYEERGEGATPVGYHLASILAGGGQVSLAEVTTVSKYFPRHEEEVGTFGWRPKDEGFPSKARIGWSLRGGDAARKWAQGILDAERTKTIIASGVDPAIVIESPDIFEPVPEYTPDMDAFKAAYLSGGASGPEFLARVRLDGSGIDRLYKIDLDGQVYVWDDGQWEDMGNVEADIWTHDRALDDIHDQVETSHVVIDPDSAVIISARLQEDPFTPVSIEDIDADEARLVADAEAEIEWDVVDEAIVAAADGPDATPGVDTPEERSGRAKTQVRDKTGKFAKVGSRVMVGGDPKATGNITRVNPSDGTVNVQLENGQAVTVPGRSVEGVGQYTTTVPGAPVEVPPVDTTGILAEPRTPMNRVGAQLPGTLPAMTKDDLHAMLNDFPAWVKGQRDSFLAPTKAPEKQKVGPKNSLDQSKNKHKVSTNPYSHPMLKGWFDKKNHMGTPNTIWYDPIVSAAAAPADPSVAKDEGEELTPETSDVQPVYMAIVAPEDPRAVLHLVSLIPASSTSTAPMTYTREDGKWTRKPEILADLNSATPPPVVPLDEETLNDVLKQVDTSHGVTASGHIPLDHALMVLFGPQKGIMEAVVAAGGLDRNRGNAEELRRYWVRGEGAAKIRWGTPGDWTRCVRLLGKHMGNRAKGYCQLRHKEATGVYTGDDKNNSVQFTTVTEVPQDQLERPVEEIIAEGVADPEFDDRWEPEERIVTLLEDEAGDEPVTAAGGMDRNRGNAEKLRRYWTIGKGGAKIRWGSGGDWTRCVRFLGKYMGPRAKGYCALRHKEMTGQWTGDKRHRQVYGRRRTGQLFSTDLVNSTNTVEYNAFLRARAADARLRMSMTAAGADTVGARFSIPLIIPEDAESGDGRVIKKGALTWRDLPLPLLWQVMSDDGHKGSAVVGRIDHIERVENGIGNAYGVFDTGPYGTEAERLVRNGFLRGVSADMDQFEAQEEEIEDEDTEAADSDEMIKKERLVISKARIMAATIVAKPAFQECVLYLAEDEPIQEEEPVIPDGIYIDDVDPLEAASLVACGYVASAIPVTPSKSWFKNPGLKAPTPLTVTDDGRVYGHIAAWHVDHIGMSFGTKPPRSRSNYAYFHTGVLRTEEGDDVPVGQLTLAGGHASLEASAAEAVRHYDDTASAVADVQAGEDAHGIWVAGALRPGVTPEQIRALRASAPSGDWRPIKGRLELVAVCQVNVPGFPVARARVASGQVYALVAAGAATLAKMKSDPMAEMSQRLERLETMNQRELESQVATIRARLAPAKEARNAELAAKAEAVSQRLRSSLDEFADVSTEARKKAAEKGEALPDGAYPIRNVADLKRAIRAYGRAKESERAKVRRHIMKRAKALGKTDLIPEDWKSASSESLTASAEALRERLDRARATFATTDEEEKRNTAKPAAPLPTPAPQPAPAAQPAPQTAPAEGEQPSGVGDGGAPVAPTQETPVEDPKYTPKTQPRDGQGRFRDILARLKQDLGVSGNQAVVEKLKETENLDNTGDYEQASKSAGDLVNIIDRLDAGALNAESLANVRLATTELGKTIANLPLPFENQAAKVRYSDLPPALQALAQDLVDKVEAKIGAEEGSKATQELKGFMSGADMYSQAEVSAQLNRMLRLLT